MSDHHYPRKVKSFEELTDIYHRFKLLSKVENNMEEAKLEPVLKYVSDMCEELQDDGTDYILKLRTIKGSLLYDEARVLLSKQKIFIALEKLRKALYLVKPYKTNPKLAYLYFRILNQLAYFLAQNNELDESLRLLEDAEMLYEQLENKTEILVFDTDDLFQEICPRKKRNALKFEKLITNNFHLQGWIYNRQQLTDKFTIYYHMVLRRQLETQDSSALVWVFKCARLASYFFGILKFREARYLLAASYYVLREYELDLLKRRSDMHFSAEWANLQKYYADLGKYWVKYGLFLFDASRRSLPNNISDTAINDILIKSFKDSPPRKQQSLNNTTNNTNNNTKSLKEKLQTIEENPSEEISSCQDLPRNNESATDTASKTSTDCKTGTNFKTDTESKPSEKEIVPSKEETKIESNTSLTAATKTPNGKGDTSQQQNEMNKDVAEITKSIIDLIDDRLKDEDNDRKYCVTKYISMLDNLTQSTQNTSTPNTIESEDAEEQVKTGIKDNKVNYQFVFPSLSLNDIESKVTNELVTSLESARNLFLFTQEWLKRSKAYYSIQDFPLDYVNLILDLNDLYRFLSLYETNIDMQYDVQKRRVDLLEKLTQILKEYRPQFYLKLNIELVNELTQAQIELILLNLRRLNAPSLQPAQQTTQTQQTQLAQQPNQKEDVYRKMDALLDIRKRLNRKESFISYCTSTMGTSLSEPEVS